MSFYIEGTETLTRKRLKILYLTPFVLLVGPLAALWEPGLKEWVEELPSGIRSIVRAWRTGL